jgi:putative phosphoesterase
VTAGIEACCPEDQRAVPALRSPVVVVAVISDTHLPRGTRRIPDGCVASMRASGLILHAGDFTHPEVLEDLRGLGPPVAAVHGNVDAEELRRLLPEARLVDADGAKIAILHDAGPAHGRLERMRARFPEADAVVFGHSHIPLHEERDGFQIFNPGSPTDKRRQPRFTMGIAEAENGRLRFKLVDLD